MCLELGKRGGGEWRREEEAYRSGKSVYAEVHVRMHRDVNRVSHYKVDFIIMQTFYQSLQKWSMAALIAG